MSEKPYLKMYIAVREEVPEFMVPTLVAHSVLGAHLQMVGNDSYNEWLLESFRKVVVKVNDKEYRKIIGLTEFPIYEGHENTTLNGEKSCVVTLAQSDKLPNVLKFAKLWQPVRV